eukprot:s1445_g4.t1
MKYPADGPWFGTWNQSKKLLKRLVFLQVPNPKAVQGPSLVVGQKAGRPRRGQGMNGRRRSHGSLLHLLPLSLRTLKPSRSVGAECHRFTNHCSAAVRAGQWAEQPGRADPLVQGRLARVQLFGPAGGDRIHG